MAGPARKIKSREDIRKIVGDRPRKKKVIMAHGCFDVVHPGHIRHLLYAKSKAPVLVASVTSDKHITKGHHRPHVPQELRALNLAALEFVDHVMVDDEPDPLKSIADIKPDFFAKGYEYREGVPKTGKEEALLASYGGEMIFTPGDVVYSSTRLLEEPPDLGHEKLLSVMDRDGVSWTSLKVRLEAMKGLRVHVVGDLIVDVLTQTALIGSNAKTPTMSVLLEGRQRFVGGAGVVAKHLKAAGADVHFSTVVGNDEDGRWAMDDLWAAGVGCLARVDTTRPTTRKEAIVCASHRLLKLDTLDNRTISDNLVAELCHDLGYVKSEAVVFSDFRHGVFNRRTIPILIDAVRAPFKAADSQVASRWGNVSDFKGFDLLTPNEKEARFSLGDQDSGIRVLASELMKAARCHGVILKVGQRGVIACEGRHKDESFVALDSFTRLLADPVGAGDALLSYAVLAGASGGSLAEAAILGSVAAAIECEVDGNVPVTAEQVQERLARIEQEVEYR